MRLVFVDFELLCAPKFLKLGIIAFLAPLVFEAPRVVVVVGVPGVTEAAGTVVFAVSFSNTYNKYRNLENTHFINMDLRRIWTK